MTLSTSDVQNILKNEKDDAIGVNTGELSDERKTAMDYYIGKMGDLTVLEGQSEAVSSDVADTIEGMMAPLMEIFAGSEEVVRFEPVGPEDEPVAEQETDYVNHVFMQKNPGFLILYSFIKDALLSKLGIVKVYWDSYEREERETYKDQDEQAFMALLMQPEKEIISHETRQDEYGATVHDLVLVNKRSYSCAKVVPVPPEEFGISKGARTVADANYLFHETTDKTESDLINMGFDAEQVRNLPGLDENSSAESSARDQIQGAASKMELTDDKPMRLVRVTEHYKVMDYQENGTPVLYCITTGGEDSEVLKRDGKPAIELCDMMPFAAATPIIMTHRVFGRSIADLVIDIQRIKTVLFRSILTNAYLANNQRLAVAESSAHERTIDDLMVNRPGGIVRVTRPDCIVPIPNQPIGDMMFPLIQYADSTREWRTGVTRQGQGIDADALQNQSATAVNQLFGAAQARLKLIARVLAETGVRDMFALLHATIRKNGSKMETVRLRNKWVSVDPRTWQNRDDMTINVALGSGSKQQQAAEMFQILTVQQQMMQAPQLGLTDGTRIYNAASKWAELMGHKNGDRYFNDPAQNPPKTQQQPTKEQVEMQTKQMEAQSKLQLEQAKQQTAAQEAQQRIALENAQAQTGIAAQTAKAQTEAALEALKHQHETEMAYLNHSLAASLNQQKMEHAQIEHNVKTGSAVPTDHIMPRIEGAMEHVSKTLADHQRQVADALTEHARAIHVAMNAPKDFVRDPKTGRVTGIRVVK